MKEAKAAGLDREAGNGEQQPVRSLALFLPGVQACRARAAGTRRGQWGLLRAEGREEVAGQWCTAASQLLPKGVSL